MSNLRPMPLDELMMRLRTQRERGEALAAPIPYASTWLDAYDDVRQDAPPARRTRHVTTQ